MNTSTGISLFEQLRLRAKAEYEARMEAIDWMERNAGSVSVAESPQHDGVDMAEIDRLEERPSLIEAVELAFNDYPDREWTVSKIARYLEMKGFKLEGKAPKSSISTAIARLVTRGVVEIVSKGTGRGSSVYKRAVQDPLDEFLDLPAKTNGASHRDKILGGQSAP